MRKYFDYTPNPYTSLEQWVFHGILFLFVLVLSSWGLIAGQGALWVMALLAFLSNWAVLGLAIYETKKGMKVEEKTDLR